MKSTIRHLVFSCICLGSLLNLSAHEGKELEVDPGLNRIPADRILVPARTTPVYQGAFSVGIILIKFPDTQLPRIAEVKEHLFQFGPLSVTEYFKEFSQNLTWPLPYLMGEEMYPRNVFTASEPYGFYCEYDYWKNPIGWKERAVGDTRGNRLRAAAKQFALANTAAPSGITTKSGNEPHEICYLFANELLEDKKLKPVIDRFYQPHRDTKRRAGIRPNRPSRERRKEPEDYWEYYGPALKWGDPLWPNSTPQQTIDQGASTLCHELGHILGPPDYYRGSEPYDGIPGEPCISYIFGPTGPGFCRLLHHGFLKPENYPHLTESGTYTLYRRNLNPVGDKFVGCLIPSAHPHYYYNLEYLSEEQFPLGVPGVRGVLVNAVNATLRSPFLGSPDMCYTYRTDDPWFRAMVPISPETSLFGKEHGRPSFSPTSEPASRLPNLTDGGVAFEILEETPDFVKLKIEITPRPFDPKTYNRSLIPKVKLDEVTDVLPHSFRASTTITFRGEPMRSDYGFCWSLRPRPTIKDAYFPLYHRDRYSGRALGIRPGKRYFVRAYARNQHGVSYSKEEIQIETSRRGVSFESVGPLLNDQFATSGSQQVVSSGQCALLKLAGYYRKPIGRVSSELRKIDYRRLHTAPRASRPEFRMVEFEAIAKESYFSAQAANMDATSFAEDFDKNFIRHFRLPRKQPDGGLTVQTVDEAALMKIGKRIKSYLRNSKPVLVARVHQDNQSSYRYPLNWVFIDGYREDEFHLSFTTPRDRNSNRKSGWYPLETVVEDVLKAKIIFASYE